MCTDVLCLDVVFETYKLESYIGSQVSMKCLAQSANSIKTILIQKIDSPVNHTVANVTLPDMTSHVNGTTVSYSNNSLTLTFTSLTCSDDGQYTCIVIKEDESQIESPEYLRVQIKSTCYLNLFTIIMVKFYFSIFIIIMKKNDCYIKKSTLSRPPEARGSGIHLKSRHQRE